MFQEHKPVSHGPVEESVVVLHSGRGAPQGEGVEGILVSEKDPALVSGPRSLWVRKRFPIRGPVKMK